MKNRSSCNQPSQPKQLIGNSATRCALPFFRRRANSSPPAPAAYAVGAFLAIHFRAVDRRSWGQKKPEPEGSGCPVSWLPG